MNRLMPICAAALLATGVAHAAEPFRVTITVADNAPPPVTAHRSFDNARQALDALRRTEIASLVPGYTGSERAGFVIDYRGMRVDGVYPADSTALNFRIDALGISERFAGATRDESRDQLHDYLVSGDVLSRILAYLAAVSPVDPLAGNPASLQTRMVRGRFLRDFGALARGGAEPAAGAALPMSAAPEVARHSADGLRTLRVDLPFSVALGEAPARPLTLDGELQLTDAAGARSVGAQAGLSWRLPMNEQWTLVPAASLGATASRDLGGAGMLAAASLTSALRLLDRPDMALWLGNGLTLTRTLGAALGEYGANPHLHNQVFTNGLLLSLLPGSLLRDQWVELSFTDSRYRGSDLYDRRYDEIGAAWVHRQGTTTWRVELNYLDATHSRGWGARLHASF